MLAAIQLYIILIIVSTFLLGSVQAMELPEKDPQAHDLLRWQEKKGFVTAVLSMSMHDDQPTQLSFEEERMKGVFDSRKDKATLFVEGKKVTSLSYSDLKEFLEKKPQELKGSYLNHLQKSGSFTTKSNDQGQARQADKYDNFRAELKKNIQKERAEYPKQVLQPIGARKLPRSKRKKRCIIM